MQKTAIALQENDRNFLEKEVAFKRGEALLTILKRNSEVEENDGLVISFEGHSQDEKNQTYWMFTMDEKSATTGAREIELDNGQSIIFSLSKL